MIAKVYGARRLDADTDGQQWRIQDFPKGGAWTLQGGGGVNTQFCQILPKTAWNWKNLDAEGGACVPHAPP